MRSLSLFVFLFIIGIVTSNAQIATGVSINAEWMASLSGPSINNHYNFVCCSNRTVFLRNNTRLNRTSSNTGNPVGSQLDNGNYRIYQRNNSGTSQIIATIPASQWRFGDIVQFDVQCWVWANNTTECVYVSYVPNSGWVNYYYGEEQDDLGLRVNNPQIQTDNNVQHCIVSNTGALQLDATTSGLSNYSWTVANIFNDPNIANPTVINPPSTNFTVTVTAEGTYADTHGSITCPAETTVDVEILMGVAPNIPRKEYICDLSELPVSINATTSGISSYSWTFTTANGHNTTTLPTTSSSIQATQVGKYCVTTIDVNGCEATNCTEVVLEPLNASIQATGTVLCGSNPSPITATAYPQGFPYSYSWSNGATTSSINISSPGTYQVTVSSVFGCQDVATVVVDEIDFNFKDVSYCFDDCNFKFTPNINNIPSNVNLTYFWDFGNGVTSTDMNPIIHFTDYGVNTISLTINADQAGLDCEYTYTFSVFNNCPDEKCDATAQFKIFSGKNGGFTLHDLSTVGNGGTIIATEWTITNVLTQQQVVASLPQSYMLDPGKYEICLKITVQLASGAICVDQTCMPHTVELRVREKIGETSQMTNTKSNFFVSPNPTTGIIQLQGEGDIQMVRVVDMKGNLLTEVRNNTRTIDMSKYPQGLYILQVIAADNTQSIEVSKM